MKKMLGLFFLVYSLQSHTQTVIDDANIEVLGAYMPNSKYGAHKVKEVRNYVDDSHLGKVLKNISVYDKNGYLVSRTNYDNSSMSIKEFINIQRRGSSFVVQREVNRSGILRSDNCIDCFWSLYLPYKNLLEKKSDISITIKSVYRYSNDSALISKTYIDGSLIDSGMLRTVYSIDKEEKVILKLNPVIVDTVLVGDSMVIVTRQIIDNNQSRVNKKYLILNKLSKSLDEFYIRDSLAFSNSILYKYDDTTGLSQEEHFGLKGKLWKKIETYNPLNKNKITRIESLYDDHGSLQSIKKFDEQNRIVFEDLNPLATGERFNEKIQIRYKYLQNGLLQERALYKNEILTEKSIFEYSYFD